MARTIDNRIIRCIDNNTGEILLEMDEKTDEILYIAIGWNEGRIIAGHIDGWINIEFVNLDEL